MVSSERTFLTKLRDRGVDDPKATLIRLETLIQQYPYFQPLHRLGWQIAEKHALKTVSYTHLTLPTNREV